MKKVIFLLVVLMPFISKSQVNIIGYVAPFGLGQYPTHADSLGYGGYRVAKDTFERNSITPQRRKKGMAVYVQSNNKMYILNDSTGLNNWTEFTTSSITKAVDSIYRKVAKDSIFYRANNIEYAIKDSSGGTLTRAVDTIYRTQSKDSIFFTIGGILRKIKDSIGVTDTANKYVNSIAKNTTKDSIVFYIGSKRYAIKDSSGNPAGSDTTSLSNRINQKLNISDTTSLSNRINQKLNISDTTALVRKTRSISTTSPLQGGGSLNGDLTLSMPYVSGGSGFGSVDGYLRYSDYLPLTQKVSPSTTISTTSPLGGGGNLGGNLTLTIQQASITTPGYITSSDYTSFASKQGALTPISPIQITGSLLSSRKASAIDSGYLSTIDWNNFNNKLSTSDTTNKFVNNVIKVNDSTIRIFKGATNSDITLTTSSIVTSATRLITSVYNNSGSTITKGSVIYINGAHSSNLPTIALAKANQEVTSAFTYGLVENDITNNSSGIVIQNGNITNLNLPSSTYSDGQTLYLSPTIAGGYTTTKPLAPYHYVAIGTITRAHPTFGTIQIAIRNGFQLDELSDVKIALVPLDSTILQFSRVDSLWHDVNPTTAMGNRFLKPSDTTNKFVNSILKNTLKDSIVFYIGSTRYAIKDSIGSGGGGGTPSGSNGYVQFNNSSSFGGDSSLFWNNTNKRLGVGTTTPSTKLDVVSGTKSTMKYNYEMATFSRNGEAKLGVYNTDNYASGTGASITFGNSKNKNANNNWPGFEFQNINDSTSWGDSYCRYNYLERDTSGNVVLANVNLFNIEANGVVRMNPFSYGLSVTPRFIIGADQGKTFNVEGDASITGATYLEGNLNIIGDNKIVDIQNNSLYTGKVNRHIVSLYDNVVTTYYVDPYDHIMIASTIDDDISIYLPEADGAGQEGREIIIKQIGNISSHIVEVFGNGFNIDGSGSVVIASGDGSSTIKMVCQNNQWYIIQGSIQ
jgi:hypothetical protein